MVSDVEEFLDGMLPRQLAAEHALCRGDAGASGDLAYTVGLEHKTVVIDEAPATYTLRVTHVYRREDGVWMTVHRHGDHVGPDAP